MKLEAKSRLVATEVTAAIGDAAPMHSAILEAGASIQQAIEALSSDPKAAKAIMVKACRMVARGMKLVFRGKTGKIVSLEPTVELDLVHGSPSMLGGVSAYIEAPGGTTFKVSWEFNLFEDHPQEFSVWLDGDLPTNDYKSSRKKGFDQAKYEKVMTSAITQFEKKGFSSPVRFGVGKFGLERK